ncbi:MAG TPA: UbiA family prenyltransferase [Candidatus Eisenbacteria bacterium]|nr:UbiA family prenyltransferase [Candidatus Eisenbacteria bacterium]
MASPLALVRPLNLLAIAIAAGVGARLGRAPLEWSALLVPVLVGAFGYARNDAVDLAADRVNRPGRPLPSGALSPRAANLAASLALAAAVALLVVTRRDALSLSIASLSASLLAAYSPWLKERGPVGPAAIALLTALAVVWGAATGSAPERAFLPALLAGASNFARECVKHLEDAPGDRAAGRKTWVVSSGPAVVTRAARLGILAALLLLPLPATAGGLGPIYLAAAVPTAGLLFVWALAALGGSAPHYGRVSAALKLSSFFGLAALALGA